MILRALFFLFFSPLVFSSDYRFRVLSFNVENLFDYEDAKAKRDETYLPLKSKQNLDHVKKCMELKNPRWALDCYYLDWGERQYSEKLKRLAAVIDSGQRDGVFDVIVFQEVENERVLQDLNRLLGSPFPFIFHKESSDARGIDVAVFSRHKAINGPHLHPIAFNKASKKLKRDWREILSVKLDYKGKSVHVFALHFPAPFHDARYRADAFRTLNRLKKKIPSADLVIAAGDFNVPKREEESKYFKEAIKNWVVSHHVGCKDCPGTNYWPTGKTWSFLDMILVSKTKDDISWKVDPSSIKLQNLLDFQKDEEGRPKRWAQTESGFSGVSDHFPIRLDVIIDE